MDKDMPMTYTWRYNVKLNIKIQNSVLALILYDWHDSKFNMEESNIYLWHFPPFVPPFKHYNQIIMSYASGIEINSSATLRIEIEFWIESSIVKCLEKC